MNRRYGRRTATPITPAQARHIARLMRKARDIDPTYRRAFASDTFEEAIGRIGYSTFAEASATIDALNERIAGIENAEMEGTE